MLQTLEAFGLYWDGRRRVPERAHRALRGRHSRSCRPHGPHLRVQLLAARARRRGRLSGNLPRRTPRRRPDGDPLSRRRAAAWRSSGPGAGPLPASSSPSAGTSSCAAAMGCTPTSWPWSWTMPRRASPMSCAGRTCWTARPGRSPCRRRCSCRRLRYAHLPLVTEPDGSQARQVTPLGCPRSGPGAGAQLCQDPEAAAPGATGRA